MAKHRKEWNQYVCVLSNCTKYNGLGFDKKAIEADLKASMEYLEIGKENLFWYNFTETDFPAQATKIRNVLEDLQARISPEVVYTHSLNDRHQDHSTAAWETIRAFRDKENIFCYETPSTLASFKPNMYENVDKYIQSKVEALMKYVTQAERTYWRPSLWLAQAEMRGQQAGGGIIFAEAFEVYRLIQ